MIVQTAYILLNVLWWIIFIQFIMSILIVFNAINLYSPFVAQLWRALETITDPIYRPIRKILPDLGGLDLSPMVVLILISIMERAVLPQILMSVY